ncbi:MAG: hypothetical protein MJ025_06925 [Victivallaceae bacterium]|nr:hypothetical protein [Victivallaceae bacterium]
MKRTLVAVLIAMIAAGCVRTGEERVKLAAGMSDAGNFKELSGYSLDLEMVGARTLVQNKDNSVRFKLTNSGNSSVTIPDWRYKEDDNILVDCQIWYPGTDSPDESEWLPVGDLEPQTEQRYPLTLEPGNQVIIEKKLDFIDRLVISKGAERRYFLKAELNLKSVKVSSPVVAIAVVPGGYSRENKK